MTENIIDSAFEAADKLGMSCVGFDYTAQSDLGAYIDRNHIWHEEPVFVPDEIIKMVVDKVEREA